ncbi:MAG: NAD(P)/FAD-dependent oxidoreductase [Pikeienuella sp.]|uniref:NAD(P)/FAD-dependent oxidoreductase n=1 Tax=Pikeienuella sp. TaxID=2831957 RepID=UPI00391A8185
MDERIVIVGAGQAGAALAAKLRAIGYGGPVTLIGEEPAPPYQRPPLSKKYLLGEMAAERLFLRPPEFYPEQGIDLLTGVAVVSIDRAGKAVALSDGRRLPYDRLALTTGSRPRLLPEATGGALGGVHAVRSLADVDRMAPDFREGARLLIVGGGYIGLEAAAVAAAKGLRVTLIELAPRILQRVAAAETADYFRDLHRAHGVDIREGVGLDRLEGEGGRVARARLATGETLDVDLVVVGIGVLPNQELAAEAGLKTGNGIETDETCATSDPAIFAAGDCASLLWEGVRIRLESVQNAIDQAEAAASCMIGAGEPYRPSPWFWSDQYDVKLQIAGLNLGHDLVVTRDGEGVAHSVWYYRGQRLLAVDAMNDPRAYMTAKRLIEAGKSPAPERAADPATPLKALMD